jgi:DNA repair protein SbcC/Rad50
VRPLRLAIDGFTAFREHEEVDFEPLELFVITGPTGAGKTSILDAIAFSLYGEVPRLGGTKGTSDVVSLGKMLAHVEFEFSIHNKGRYKIARRLSRRPNQPQTLTFERWDGAAWVPECEGGVRESNKRIIEIVGLDFDAFTRAVLLPQGEFHRFLKGDIGERRKVLFSLLGVFYFQKMAALARNRRTVLDARVKRTDELLAEQYADATPENVETLRAAATSAADDAQAVSESLAKAAERGKAAADAKARAAVIDAGRIELETLADELNEVSEKAGTAEAGYAAAEQRLDAKTNELEKARKAAGAAEQQARAIEAEVGSLEQLAEAATAARTLRETVKQEKNGEEELGKAVEEVNAGQRALDEALAKHEAITTELTALRHAETAAISQANDAKTASGDIARSATAARTADTELDTVERELRDHQTVLEQAAAGASAAHELLAGAVNALDEHRRIHAVAELAHGLQVADACPVCGVALAAAVPIAPDAATALTTAREGEEQARRRCTAADRALAQAETKLSSLEAKLDECTKRLASALDGHQDLGALAAAAKTAEDAAAAAAARAQEATDRRGALEREHEQVSQHATDARVAATRSEERRAAAAAALELIRKRREDADALLRLRFGGAVPSDAAAQISSQRDRLTAAADSVSTARERSDGLTAEHETIRDQLSTRQHELAALDLELTRARTIAEGAHVRLRSAPASVVLERLPAGVPERAVAASELSKSCSAAGQRLVETRIEVDNQATNSGNAVIRLAAGHGIEASDPERALELLKQTQQQAIKRTAAAQAAVVDGERRVAQRAEMEEQVKDEREQIVVLDALARELQVDRLGEYIVEETLDLLSARASEELLQISGGRYSLTPIKGEFYVVDRANADERRSVKTLSGGETFLASLALALALSQHVGELAGDGMGAKLESVFIDEGFGTLDPATLDDVIDALERLRAQELVVGVISHVPELAQRIQSGLSVQQINGRSRIVPVGAE